MVTPKYVMSIEVPLAWTSPIVEALRTAEPGVTAGVSDADVPRAVLRKWVMDKVVDKAGQTKLDQVHQVAQAARVAAEEQARVEIADLRAQMLAALDALLVTPDVLPGT